MDSDFDVLFWVVWLFCLGIDLAVFVLQVLLSWIALAHRVVLLLVLPFLFVLKQV